jgi:hypothetical protein
MGGLGPVLRGCASHKSWRSGQRLSALARGFERARRCQVRRFAAKASCSLRRAAPASLAEALFRAALELAHRYGVVSWELRAPTSLARLLKEHSRSAEALALFHPVYRRMTEGFDTADVKAAKSLLDTPRIAAGWTGRQVLQELCLAPAPRQPRSLSSWFISVVECSTAGLRGCRPSLRL